MPAVTPLRFNCLTLDMGRAIHNFESHTLKLLLTNTAPSLSNTIKGNLTEIAAGGGYPAGGFALTIASWTQTSGVAKLLLNDYNFTATGNVADFRYASIYNDTSPTDALMWTMDYGATVSGMTTNEQFLFDFDGAAGALFI
jgi:hypothetical protein